MCKRLVGLSIRCVIIGIGVVLFTSPLSAAPGEQQPSWPLTGRQGLVGIVIVPAESVADRQAYDAQISRLCDPNRTCFLNFYTNSTGAEASVPLPAAIANEPAAIYRRSVKRGMVRFMWSCRVRQNEGQCF